MSVVSLVIASLLITMSAFPAELPRRTYLGLQFDLTDQSAPGLLVTAVFDHSTAQDAGMREGDRLTSVGQVDDLENFADLRRELAATAAGSRIALRWYRGNRVFRVAPELRVLPSEAVPGSRVRYDAVVLDGVRQRLIVSEPEDDAPAVIFYLQGLGCASQDFWFDSTNSTKALIDGWAAAGFATARLEKRGMGDSEGEDCGSLDFNDERRGYAAAIERLVELGYRDRIFLFGHSLGGVIAPLLVTTDVVGIMVYGTVGVPWYDYMMKNFERQDRLGGRSDEDISTRQALRARFQQGLLFEGRTPGELKALLPGAAALEDVQLADDEHYYGRSVAFFQQLAAIDPERTWRVVWQPVLALHGEFDWVSDRADHERIARLSGGKFLSVAGLDHGFLRYESLEQSFVARRTGSFDHAVVDATLVWMRAQAALDPADSRAGSAAKG